MTAGYQELFIEQGADFSTSITLNDIYGAPYDLTDVSAKGQIRKSYYSSNTSSEFTISITDPTDGIIVLSLDSANTTNIRPGRYVYDVSIKDSANTITRILEGILNIDPQVTRF